MKIAVTGANSSVGLNLLNHIISQTDISVIAGVRSERAAQSLPVSAQIEPRIISYDDTDALAQSLQGADCVIHLAGILIENKHSNYASANVDATAAAVKAAENIAAKHFVFISVVGASTESLNAYFRSKGSAEQAIRNSDLSASIIRTPILLGPETAGASSIIGAASQNKAKVLGGGNYTIQPLDIDDLNQAIMQCCVSQQPGTTLHELVGPEPISYRQLIQRTAGLMGKQVEIGSIPIWLAKLGALVNNRLKGEGITPTVIDVITIDEVVAHNADETLGITLTPLSNTLKKILKHSPINERTT